MYYTGNKEGFAETYMALQAESVSIVVVGEMNPAIHHPSWYRRVGICDATSEEKALDDKATVCSPAGSQFSTSDFHITCLPDRWVVKTVADDAADRILEVALRTFLEKLPETPLTAYGFNFDCHIKTKHKDTRPILAGLFNELPIRPNNFNCLSASFRAASGEKGRITRLQIEPSGDRDDCVFISHNFHYDVDDESSIDTEANLAKAEAEARDRFKVDKGTASEYRDEIDSAIAKLT